MEGQNLKKYYAPTILDLGIAYSNARLACKLEIDWLNQKTINSELNEAMNKGDFFGHIERLKIQYY